MVIGMRLRTLREERNLSQGDIEKRSGLLRCYISRVENGHTIPSLATLEKLAAVLEIPLFRVFYDGEEPPPLRQLSGRLSTEELLRVSESESDKRFLQKLKSLIDTMGEQDRELVLLTARKLAAR
ncbi:MAG TPA: helix-turn-helix domain-containing protein [Terriglobia bacterium]|jgi:transcriptional regulator with XRE-family HTH domain|nr:helix-turn-helix domain-containing protein [Terriglobia bacterium]